jgi:hypothetical protein
MCNQADAQVEEQLKEFMVAVSSLCTLIGATNENVVLNEGIVGFLGSLEWERERVEKALGRLHRAIAHREFVELCGRKKANNV